MAHLPTATGSSEPLDARRFRERGWWRTETVVDDLRRWARESPDRLAVVSHFWETADRADVCLTYAELAARVDRAAAGLLELGVRPGDRVAMQLVNQWQASVLILACARIGAVVVPFFIATGATDTEWVLRESEASVVVSLDEVRGVQVAKTIAGLRDRLPALRHHVVVGDPKTAAVPEAPAARSGAAGSGGAAGPGAEGSGAVGSGMPRAEPLGFEEDLLGTAWEERHPDLDDYAPGADDLFQIMYTSGTTGRPKGVMHTYNTLYAMSRSYTLPLGLGAGDVLTTPCIIGGQGGWLYGLLTPLLIGGTSVWADAYKPEDFLELARTYGITAAYFTPAILDLLIAEQRERPRPLELRHMVTGSTPIPPRMPLDFHEVFGLPLLPLWGMTENGGVTIGRPGDPWDWAAHSDGSPVEWMRLRLVGEDGREVTGDAPGRLEISGANMCVGYYQAAEIWAESLHDGWFVTGDLARPDGRGGIKIIGRVKDLINKGGIHVPSVTVEAILREDPGVREVAVVGEPVAPLGEQIVAFVVADGTPPTLAELQDRVRAAGMTRGYEPDRLEVVAELPKTATGKIRKRELEDRLAARPRP